MQRPPDEANTGQTADGFVIVYPSRGGVSAQWDSRWRVIGELLATSPWQPGRSVATRAGKARTEVDLAGQLDLFDDAMAHPLPTGADRKEGRSGELEELAARIAHASE